MKLKYLPLLMAAALAACDSKSAATPAAASQTNTVQAASETASTTIAASGNTVSDSATTASAVDAGIPSVDVRKDNIGGDFTLTDGSGKPFALSSLKGKAVILSFGFTNCPDVCPTELLTYSDALKQLGDKAKDVAVVFVSVDYERDTPELISKYVAQFNPNFIGLTDSNGGRDIAMVKQQYRIVSAKTEIQSDTVYNVDHSSGAYLIDKNGEVAIFEPFGAHAPQIAADLSKLLAE
ncbi:SCO family protein [Kingella kingae]|uniref:SCO family protein n=1 Tax=Kingella kingae TaxID=504 RepID=UPI000307F4A8|nr:SCO family protein [Kingella kingae]MDK4555562.1 SCO family protein [Kingella kingae]MDK4585213.1 SCO family protein [Kingella kingae]MDK4588653.1 SCO family protein [Kingella kingae]MDK4611314.1 SCO family protein [Kingella kingae]MDK4642457.1 SCO family protein [Kingella kingae]